MGMITEASASLPIKIKRGPPEYLRLRRNFGWIVLGAILISLPFQANEHVVPVAILATLGIGYNVLFYLSVVYKHDLLVRKQVILIVDTSLMLLLLAFSNNGAASAYTSLLIFPIISSALWYGTWVSMGIGAAEILAVVIGTFVSGSTVEWSKMLETFGFRMLFFILVGVYISWLTHEDRQERRDLAEKDMQINQERQQLLSLINNMGDAVLVVNEDGNIGLFNDTAAKLVGSQYALVGKPL